MNRAGFYRRLAVSSPAECDMELRDRMQRISLENRRYGYRRVTAELRRQGFLVNHKKVLRMMRKDNLLAVLKRRFVLTTDSNHFLPVYPNLAAHLNVDGVDQLWQSDITYIRLREAFVYLAYGGSVGMLDGGALLHTVLGTHIHLRQDAGHGIDFVTEVLGRNLDELQRKRSDFRVARVVGTVEPLAGLNAQQVGLLI